MNSWTHFKPPCQCWLIFIYIKSIIPLLYFVEKFWSLLFITQYILSCYIWWCKNIHHRGCRSHWLWWTNFNNKWEHEVMDSYVKCYQTLYTHWPQQGRYKWVFKALFLVQSSLPIAHITPSIIIYKWFVSMVSRSMATGVCMIFFSTNAATVVCPIALWLTNGSSHSSNPGLIPDHCCGFQDFCLQTYIHSGIKWCV